MAHSKPLQTKHWLALLGTLFVIVLIAHLAIITTARGQFGTTKSAQTETFTTRMVEPPAPKPGVEAPPKPVKPKTKVAVAPKEVPNPTLQQATQVAPLLLPLPVESASTSLIPEPSPSPQLPTATEVVQAAAEPSAATAEATVTGSASGESRQPSPAFVTPFSAKHVYKVMVSQKGSIYQGKAEVLLQQDGEKYALSLSLSQLLYGITWKSIGVLSPQGFKPERFSDKRTFKSEVAAHFDRVAGKIMFSSNTPPAELEGGAQDRISVIWQLAGILAAESARYPTGTTISIQTADDREAQLWVFTVNGLETLNLESGSHSALRLTRMPRREFDRKIEIWFAPEMGYLPVRLRQSHVTGDYDDMTWQNSQVLTQPAKDL